MKINGTVQVEISEQEQKQVAIAYLWKQVYAKVGEVDDAGCDWCTAWDTDNMVRFGVFIDDNPDWKITDDEDIMILVDAINIVRNGETMTASWAL